MTTSSKTYSILFVAFALLFGACGCEKKVTPEEPQPQETLMDNPDMSLIEASVPVTDNWVWSGKPQITIHIANGNPGAVKVGTKVVVTTDKKADVVTLTDSVVISSKSQKDFVVTTTADMEPGIYHAVCHVNGKSVRAFNFAIDPFEITSVNDKPADFDQFWQTAKDQLAAIDMHAQLTEIPERSNANGTVYL